MKNLKRIMVVALSTFIFALTLPTVSVFAVDADMNYGRTKLNADQQYVYDAIVNGCKDAKADIKINLTGKNVDFNNDLGKILTMFFSDTPEYFWYSGGWGASYDGTTLTISLSYTMKGDTLNSAKSAYNKKVSELTKGLDGKSDYEKSKILHDRLIDSVTYTSTANDQNAYGALVEGKAVCNGYARAYQHLMKKVGIPTWYVRGVSVNPTTDIQIGHAWNLVKLDGKWYYTDVTWDDQGESTFYEYLNITTDKMKKGHTLDSDYASLVPKATSTNANYYKIESREFTKYDQAKLVGLLKKDNNKTQIYVNGDVNSFLTSVSSELLNIGKQLGGNGAFQVSYSATTLENAVIINIVVISESHTHRAKTTVKQVNASCLTNGTKAHYLCDCGLIFLDSACTKSISSDSELIIPAKAHTPSGWKNDATSHWKECTGCGSETANTRGEHGDKNKDNKCDTCDYALPVADESGNIVVGGSTTPNNNSGSVHNTPSNPPKPTTSDKDDTPSTQVDDTAGDIENTQDPDQSNSDAITENNDVAQDKTTEETEVDSSAMKWIICGVSAVVVAAGVVALIVLKKKKSIFLFLFLGMLLFCSSCNKEEIVSDSAIPKEDDLQDIVVEEKHSKFYLEGYSVEEVLKYFNEVVLDTEYTTGSGDVTLVQRWDIPIRYQVVGDSTKEDIAILEDFLAELNKVEGFSGVSEAAENEVPNLYIYFEGREAFNDRYNEFLQNEYADGAARYWYYTETNDIYEGTIGYCTDMSEEVKESVLLEELVNCLGIGDSVLREDSIVHQYGSSVTELSDMDWLIIKLLYHPRIRCGMDIAQCEEVIRELYY